jgi:hypothetical protein
MIELTDADQSQLGNLGISQEVLNDQLAKFTKGVPPIQLSKPATPGNGITQLNADETSNFISIFNQKANSLEIRRFVPASGAASRMFKAFHQYLNDGVETEEIKTFSAGLKKFAFYNDIKCKNEPDYGCAIHNMIKIQGLSELPKALIPFHSYINETRTAIEEHLVESALVISDSNEVKIYFTISEAHQEKFQELLNKRLTSLEKEFGKTFDLSFSYQHHSTDTVAVNTDNTLFRNDDGSLLFRPGGHGSLLVNLNDVDGDLIFVKNIDNIQIDHLKSTTVRYKQILAGYLINLQAEITEVLNELDSGQNNLDSIVKFAKDKLNIKIEDAFNGLEKSEQIELLRNKLNRPIRICGMVKNEGEPGGGPFWTINSSNEESLQIVESSQVDLADSEQAKIFKASTHFNPVDLVCWVRDYKGKKFDLTHYADPETAFITEKSQQGKTLKVLEHPGLWNGAMADWITVFVEVPIETFSPVKTINDLLRPQHQPE